MPSGSWHRWFFCARRRRGGRGPRPGPGGGGPGVVVGGGGGGGGAGPPPPPGEDAGRQAAAPVMEEHPLGDLPADDPRMESYAHGNYILGVVDFLWSAGLLALIVFSGFSATLQVWAGKVARGPNLKVAVYVALFTLVTFAGSLPLAVFSGFVREKRFGFANQTFAAWMGDRGKALLIGIVLQTLFFMVLYAAIRRLGRRWWVAGAGLAIDRKGVV